MNEHEAAMVAEWAEHAERVLAEWRRIRLAPVDEPTPDGLAFGTAADDEPVFVRPHASRWSA